MKWLHISDIHFDLLGDGSSTTEIRDKLIDYLKSANIHVDELFITGDFRFARNQPITSAAAASVANFIKTMASTVGITQTADIYLVPGNHDLNRNYPSRSSILVGMKSAYDEEAGDIGTSDLKNAIDSLEFYHLVCEKLYGKRAYSKIKTEMYKNPHRAIYGQDCNLLLLNTALFCGTDADAGSLFIGTKYLMQSMLEIKKNSPAKPIIALGHHGINNYSRNEQRHIAAIFENYGVRLFLCGHEHELWHQSISDNSFQVNSGCLKFEKEMQPSFCVGDLNPQKNIITITAYLWDCHFRIWNQYPHFGNVDSEYVLQISQPFSNMVSFDSLPSMFSDVTDYLDQTRNNSHSLYGYGIDLQVVLPWMEKMVTQYQNQLSFKVLVYDDMIFNSDDYSLTSAFDRDTLQNSAIRLGKIRKSIAKTGNRIQVKKSVIPYAFHGLVVDNRLYFTWLKLRENGNIENQLPIHRIIIGDNYIQDQFVNSFSSWFQYYWEHASDLVNLGE